MFRPGQAGAGGTFASASDVLLTVTTPVTVLTYTPTVNRNFLANISFKSTLGTPTFKEPVFTPALTASLSGEFGNRFTPTVDGFVSALRWYKVSGSTTTHYGNLWEAATGRLIATVVYTGETTSGWQQTALATPVLLTAGTMYLVTINAGVDTFGYDGVDPGSPFVYSPTGGYPFTFPNPSYLNGLNKPNQVPVTSFSLRAGVDLVFAQASKLTLTLNWTDANGAQSLVLLSSIARPAGIYALQGQPIAAVAGSPVTVVAQATVANLLSVTAVLS